MVTFIFLNNLFILSFPYSSLLGMHFCLLFCLLFSFSQLGLTQFFIEKLSIFASLCLQNQYTILYPFLCGFLFVLEFLLSHVFCMSNLLCTSHSSFSTIPTYLFFSVSFFPKELPLRVLLSQSGPQFSS